MYKKSIMIKRSSDDNYQVGSQVKFQDKIIGVNPILFNNLNQKEIKISDQSESNFFKFDLINMNLSDEKHIQDYNKILDIIEDTKNDGPLLENSKFDLSDRLPSSPCVDTQTYPANAVGQTNQSWVHWPTASAR